MSISITVKPEGARFVAEFIDDEYPFAAGVYVFRTHEEASRYAVSQADLLSIEHAEQHAAAQS